MSHQGAEDNEIAYEWSKQAIDQLDADRLEWLNFTEPHGIVSQEETLPAPEILRRIQA